jgi:hypothetical protein
LPFLIPLRLRRCVWKQRDVTRTLDSFGEHALVSGTRARNSTRQDFAAFGNVVLQELNVLKVDEINLVYAETANFATVHAAASSAAATAATAAATATATRPAAPQINIFVAVKPAIIHVIARHYFLSSQHLKRPRTEDFDLTQRRRHNIQFSVFSLHSENWKPKTVCSYDS